MAHKLKSKEKNGEQEKSRFEKIGSIVTKMLGIFTAAIVLYVQIKEITKEPFIINECTYMEETHAGEKYEKYTIKTEPTIKIAKLCIQPYIEITYQKSKQVILLDNLYTQQAYIYEADTDTYNLLKKCKDQAIYDELQTELRKELELLDLPVDTLDLESGAILCFDYSEIDGQAKYYKLIASTLKKVTRFQALKILNTKGESIHININDEQIDILTIVDRLIKNIKS